MPIALFLQEARVGSRLDDTLSAVTSEVMSWVYVGSYRAHYKAVKSLVWGEPSTAGGTSRLWTVGEDGYLVEYDIDGSSVGRCLVLLLLLLLPPPLRHASPSPVSLTGFCRNGCHMLGI